MSQIRGEARKEKPKPMTKKERIEKKKKKKLERLERQRLR